MINQIKTKYPAVAADIDAFAMPGTAVPMPGVHRRLQPGHRRGQRTSGTRRRLDRHYTGNTIQTASAKAGTLPNSTEPVVSGHLGYCDRTSSGVEELVHSTVDKVVKRRYGERDPGHAPVDRQSGHTTVDAAATRAADQKINEILAGS